VNKKNLPQIKYPYRFMKGDLKNIETIKKQKESWKENDTIERFTVWWVTHLDKYIFTPNLSKGEVLSHFGIDEKTFNGKLDALFLGVRLD
jgi:hypothetical protein